MKQLFTLTLLVITRLSFATGYSGGNGTQAMPYLIANKSDLQYLSEHPDDWGSYFEQTAHISFTAADFEAGGDFYNNGAGFSPIGNNSGSPFTGKYMAFGYTIDHLYINRPSQNYVGLFGYANGSDVEISALKVTNATVFGSEYVGILIGEMSSGNVNGSFTSGSVSAVASVGGLCGRLGGGSVVRCQSDIQVSGTNDLGGLIGIAGSASLSYSDSRGTVNGNGQVGGLVGRAEYSPISECYSICEVSGDAYVGGLLGVFDSETLLHCYAAGDVTGNSDTGGLIGLNFGTIQGCFWDTQSTGQTSSQGGTGKTQFEMQTRATFTTSGWDFTDETANGSSDHWKMGECNNDGYPVFYWQSSTAYPEVSFGTLNGNLLDSATICYDESATMHASSWDNVTWYDSITAGNEVSSNSSYTTPNLTATTIYYAQVNNTTCVNPFRLAFTVVVRPENVTNQTFDFCGSDSVTVGNNTYTATGVYTDLFTAASGCDSTVITHLNIHPELDPGTYMDDEITIAAAQMSATYQWINCATNMPIDGANSRFFTATENGEYAVIITSGPCTDTSDCVSIQNVGITEYAVWNAPTVAPNPFREFLTVSVADNTTGTMELQVVNVLGQEVYRGVIAGTTPLNLQALEAGTYMLTIHNNAQSVVYRIIKE